MKTIRTTDDLHRIIAELPIDVLRSFTAEAYITLFGASINIDHPDRGSDGWVLQSEIDRTNETSVSLFHDLRMIGLDPPVPPEGSP